MVLSTVAVHEKPEAATLECAVMDNLHVIFDTFRHFRKYTNLCRNPAVAMVFGWRDAVTVQLEGKAEELSADLLEYYQGFYLRKVPGAYKFAIDPKVAWFRVIPSWLRYTDVARDPWRTFELDLTQDV